MIYFDLAWFENDLAHWEGFRSTPYQDTLGVWTVGYGATVWHGIRVKEGYPLDVTEEQARGHLRQDAWVAIIGAQQFAKDVWRKLNKSRQAVLANMAFQLGQPKLMKFVRTRALILDEKLDLVAAEFLDSRWARQTERRARKMAQRWNDD